MPQTPAKPHLVVRNRSHTLFDAHLPHFLVKAVGRLSPENVKTASRTENETILSVSTTISPEQLQLHGQWHVGEIKQIGMHFVVIHMHGTAVARVCRAFVRILIVAVAMAMSVAVVVVVVVVVIAVAVVRLVLGSCCRRPFSFGLFAQSHANLRVAGAGLNNKSNIKIKEMQGDLQAS